MKNFVLAGILSMLSAVGAVGIMAPARATDDGMPVGTIIAWGGVSSSVPANWMLCNGKALSKSVYKELFTAIGTSWGSADDKFNLPDLRGRFLRGEDAGTHRDPDAKNRKPCNPGGSATGVGSVQDDMMQNHTHDQAPHSHNFEDHNYSANAQAGLDWQFMRPNPSTERSGLPSTAYIMGAKTYKTKSQVKTGEETRPKNASVNFIIKVK